MNRTLKNVLMVILLVLLGISIYWTATYQTGQRTNFRKNEQMQEMQQGNKNRREKVLESSEESSASSEKEDTGSMQTSLPPDMNQNGMTQDQTMPEPENEQVQEMQHRREKVLDSSEESFSKSENMQPSLPPDMNQNGMPQNQSMPEPENIKNPFQYITLGIEVVFFSLILIYLILSKGNRKSFKEVFASSKEVGIFSLLSVVALYSGVVFLSPL